MVAPGKVSINRATVAKLLNSSAMAQIVNGAVDSIASKIDGEVHTSAYTTDRQAGSVTVPTEDQAATGALTRACAAAGLEFTPKS